jgi:hypothetical protein
MTLLKDLLALREPAKEPLEEARQGGDMHGLIDKWMDMNKAYSWEGSRGMRNFRKLVADLGYRDVDEFFEDNSGAFEALLSWIQKSHVPEWAEKLRDVVGGDDDDDDDDEDK